MAPTYSTGQSVVLNWDLIPTQIPPLAIILPHPRLQVVENAAHFIALVQDNFEVLAADVAKREATYQNGAPTMLIGPPISGTHVLDEFWRNALGDEWRCTAAGTPGTWIQFGPADVTADPTSGTIPVGYLVWNVTDGAVKRQAGSHSWEISVGAGTAAKVGFLGATPTAQRANANQAATTDLASVTTLAYELWAALIETGLIKGGALRPPTGFRGAGGIQQACYQARDLSINIA